MLLKTNFIKWVQIFFFFAIPLIFYNNHNVANALIGYNIREAVENEFPFIISIVTIINMSPEIERNHRCTATLVSNQDAVTSARCLSTIEIEGFRFLIGSHDLRQSQVYYCMWWWSYNYWAQQRNMQLEYRENDVAFIKIMGNVPNIGQYGNMPTLDSDRLYGREVVTATWGVTNTGRPSRMLNVATLTILTPDDCGERISTLARRRYRVQRRRICTIADPYILLQNGDSGGPLLFEGAIVGINHAVAPELNGQCHPEQVNMHFGLYYYRVFILDVRHNTQTHIVYPPA